MKGKKELLARTLVGGGAVSLLSQLPVWGRDELRILAYHRVFDVADELLFPFDPALISTSTAGFRQQMEYVASNFTPVTCSDVLTALNGGRELPGRAVVITFDDGHLDNYTNAFPVLRNMGIPATIFLSTGYIGTTQMFWFEQVAYALFRAPACEVAIPRSTIRLVLADTSSRRRAADVLREHLKNMPDQQRRVQIDWLVESLKTRVRAEDRGLSGAMTWDQVREMSRASIEFGSHTVSHPILTQLDDTALERELVDSRTTIAKMVGTPPIAIAYPDGGTSAFDARVIAAVRHAGYQLGLSYVSGVNLLNRINRFAIRRMHVEQDTSQAMFRAMLELPRIFSI